MRIVSPAYGPTAIDVGPLETALYQGVAGGIDATPEEVAVELFGCHGVPSDGFYAAFDHEVSTLRERFLAQQAEGKRS